VSLLFDGVLTLSWLCLGGVVMISWSCCGRVVAVDLALSWLCRGGFVACFVRVVALIRFSNVASLLSNIYHYCGHDVEVWLKFVHF
jgi:hypothetical protein